MFNRDNLTPLQYASVLFNAHNRNGRNAVRACMADLLEHCPPTQFQMELLGTFVDLWRRDQAHKDQPQQTP